MRHFLRSCIWPIARNVLGIHWLEFLMQMILGEKRYACTRRLMVATIRAVAFAEPRAIFVLQIVFATIATAFALAQKFSRPTGFDRYLGYTCSLNNTAEDKMDFGQLLNILSLALPLISAWEAYIGEDVHCCCLLSLLIDFLLRGRTRNNVPTINHYMYNFSIRFMHLAIRLCLSEAQRVRKRALSFTMIGRYGHIDSRRASLTCDT